MTLLFAFLNTVQNVIASLLLSSLKTISLLKIAKLEKLGKIDNIEKVVKKQRKRENLYLVSDSGMTEIYINPMTVKPKENP